MLQTAISRWCEVLGEAHVSVDPAALQAAATATFAATSSPVAIVRPGSTAEVQAVVRIARASGIPLHVISRGRNWGYGSRQPHVPGSVVVDLGRMDRIVDFDERLAYVTVEPGVSFRQLARYLRTIRARVFASVTGGTPDGSVLANALERGDGSGPLGDRVTSLCALEVVLPDGEVIHTGFGRYPGAPVAPLARHGVGPSLDGLFAQSGFGIVTRATVHLTPYPAAMFVGAFTLDHDAGLPALVDAARALRLSGVVRTTVPLWNDHKALALVTQYPWAQTDVTPLPDALRLAMRSAIGFGRWNGSVGLYGASAAHAAALRDVVADALGPVTSTLAFRPGPDDPLDAPDDACGPHLGVPAERGAAATYWRKRTPPPADLDPDRDRCGFLWLSHAVPFTGEHAMRFASVVERELLRDGFEPQTALLGVGERALSAVASISYDRDVPDEDARALACFERTHDHLLALGYPPFRTGVLRSAPPGEAAYERTVAAIATALGASTTPR